MKRLKVWRLAALCAAVLAAPGGVAAQKGGAAGAEAQRLEFAGGRATEKRTGSVRGYESHDYEFDGAEGQAVAVKLTSTSRFLYFNILDKSTTEAIETDPPAREVTEWAGTLPKAGTYVIRVYLVRAEARRNRSAAFTLEVVEGGAASSAAAALVGVRPSPSARRI